MRASLLALLLCAGAAAAPLDGTRWKMSYRSARTWLPLSRADKLAFDSGAFTSYGSLAYGFSPSSYTARSSGGVLRWSAVSFNPDGEALAWEGVRAAGSDRMQGAFVWRQADGTQRRYLWKARLRPAPGRR